MSKIILAAGVAALALSTPALAQNHGNGHGGGHGQQDKSAKGNAKGQGHDGKGSDSRMEVKHDRGNGHGPKVKIDRDDHRGGPSRTVNVMPGSKGHGDSLPLPRLAARGGLIDGCPPGLAMKDNGCLPPGQAKKVGTPLARAAAGLLGPYGQWYRDNDRHYYRMDDGVLYQVNRSNGLIDALIPYGTRDYSYYPVGYNYPSLYNSYNLPTAYRSYYPDGGDTLYRYGGNAIYAVDPQTQLVTSIVSLLAGDLSVGQPLPTGYGVYNVPLAYRDRYMDSANDWYRYNDGYVYRVDPTTRLVTAVIDALV